MKKICLAVISLLLLFAVSVCAAPIFGGYGKQPWGASIKSVTRAYPKGKLAKLGSQDVYKQIKPSREIKQRTFAFAAEKLVAVSVTMDPEYVTRNGIEKLLKTQQKLYGEGQIDRTGAPHMVKYSWQDQQTRITFAYAPKRPEMTVFMYEKK
jgi:5-formyltetrahydrofolate cyclo-ligase